MTEDIKEQLKEVICKLESFSKLNPSISIEMEKEKVIIHNPWEDQSICFQVTNNNDDLIDSLNHLLFPPQLSAIFHIDSLTFEFIYTVASQDDQLWTRQFEFFYKGETYTCKFGASSDRLMHIASASRFVSPLSQTDFRNLRIYHDFCCQEKLPPQIVQFFKNKSPMSFYFGPFKPQNTDQLIELARHLNFYMYYFDRETPMIQIHQPINDIQVNDVETKVIFPDRLLGYQIDSYMIDLWTSASKLNGRLAFIYYYQMLEYAAFYYIEADVKLRIEKILKSPDMLSSTSSCLTQVFDEIVDYRQSDEQKLNAIVKRAVNPEKLWNVMERYKDFFCDPQVFDGGFTIEPFIKKEWNSDDFEKSWIPKVPDKLRQIRNALVHSRESRVGQVIAPTRLNNRKLLPWINVIEEISCQVAIYKNL